MPAVNLLLFEVSTVVSSNRNNSWIFGTQHLVHCKVNASGKKKNQVAHCARGMICGTWEFLAQNHSSMLTGTAKCTAKDQDSRAENGVSGQMFSTESTVERICIVCFPLNLSCT